MNGEKDTEIMKDEELEAQEPELEEDPEEEPDIDIEGDDLEFDENGDIIVPDEEDEPDGDEDTDEEPADEESEEAEEAETDESEQAQEGEQKPEEAGEKAPPAPPQDDPKDVRILALERELAALKSQSRATLKHLGVDEGDEMAGLVKLAAEAEGVSREEYLRRKDERERAERAVREVQNAKFDAKIAADLAEVQAAYPDAAKYASVKDFPNFKEFGRLRDLGLSPKQAYIAAHPDAVRENVAQATRRQTLNDGKGHLKPAVSRASKDTSLKMTRRELAECRDLFHGMSDKEILALYRSTAK